MKDNERILSFLFSFLWSSWKLGGTSEICEIDLYMLLVNEADFLFF